MTRAQRIAELNELAAQEGIQLPYSAEFIVEVEDRGHYVDLTSGFFGDSRETVTLTPIGEAEIVAWLADKGGTV